MSIQNRRGKDADFDANKMLPGELAVTTDGTRKVYTVFAPGDAREVAFKDQIPIVGDVTPDKLQEAVNNYLNENPVHAGATEEEAKQIELNRKNIEVNNEAIEEVSQELEKTNTNVAQLSNPNLFINGNFQIWSNGEEFTVAINDDGTYGGYVVTADRWTVGAWSSDTAYVYKTDKGLTFSRERAAPIDVFQVLEEETLKSILGKNLTMSYAIEDATGIYQEYARNVVLEENVEIEPFTISKEYFCIELQVGCTLIWAKLEVGEVATPCIPDSKDVIVCKLENSSVMTSGEVKTMDTLFGKPVYTKSYRFTDGIQGNTVLNYPHGITDAEYIWVDLQNSFFISIINGLFCTTAVETRYHGQTAFLQINVDQNSILCDSDGGWNNGWIKVVTLRYTKTTD